MTPTPQQAAIIEEPSARILVLAGAGSGKTRTLIWRIQADIHRGINPAEMVAITFTNRAARELINRLDLQGIKLGFVGTLHAFALHHVNRNRLALGYMGPITILDEESASKIRKTTLKDLYLPASTSPTDIDEAIGTTSKSNAGLAAKAYLKNLRRLGMADFTSLLADLEELAWKGMVDRPSALYVDEYQDSGARDERIYTALEAKIDIRVGDADQSMYSFRGGKIENIMRLAAPKWSVHHLSANYRSARAILDYANTVIAANPSNSRIAMTATTERIGLCEITSYPNDLVEAMSIAAIIKDGGRPPRDYAVLTRYNARAGDIRRALASRSIPVATLKRAEQPPRLIAALHALQAPTKDTDSVAWVTSVESPGLNVEAARTGGSLTATLLRRLCVHPGKEPIGASLQKMGMQAFEIALVRDAWTGDYNTTILALQLAEEEVADDGVHVGTVHSFKGGEKPVVFYAGLEAHTTPGRRSQPEIEEERRILYVAITRGQEQVRLSWCQRAPDSIGRTTLAGERSPLLQ